MAIVDVTGAVAIPDRIMLTDEEAKLLRAYKKFLLTHDLREAVYCQRCWSKDLSDGTQFFVTPDKILIKCRCAERMYLGASL